jgi:hypothetical protein
MNALKTTLAALLLMPAGLLFAGGPGPGFGPGPVPVPEIWIAAEKTYYLTRGLHQGNDVLKACAPKYHVASPWELLDVSNLTYNTVLGMTVPDSGYGPPAGYEPGWLRTADDGPNCLNWTTINPGQMGFIGSLSITELLNGNNGWTYGHYDCGDHAYVWCVSDPVIMHWPYGAR